MENAKPKSKSAGELEEKIGEWIIFVSYLGAIFAFYYFTVGGGLEKAIMGLLYKYGLL
jgi:hypothetical protein